MTTFDDKEKASENKYAHDQELKFKVHARAHKLLGLWAASKMGLTGGQAEEYAKALVTIDLSHGNNHHLFEKIKNDLLARDVHLSDHDIHAEIFRCEQIAHEQVAGE